MKMVRLIGAVISRVSIINIMEFQWTINLFAASFCSFPFVFLLSLLNSEPGFLLCKLLIDLSFQETR